MNLGMNEILVIGLVVLLLFGGKKIPEVMHGLGKGIGELKKGMEEGKRTLTEHLEEESGDGHTAA